MPERAQSVAAVQRWPVLASHEQLHPQLQLNTALNSTNSLGHAAAPMPLQHVWVGKSASFLKFLSWLARLILKLPGAAYKLGERLLHTKGGRALVAVLAGLLSAQVCLAPASGEPAASTTIHASLTLFWGLLRSVRVDRALHMPTHPR